MSAWHQKAASILRKEGLAGLAGRLRNPKVAPAPAPPQIGTAITLAGEVESPMGAALSRTFAAHGIQLAVSVDAGPRLHVGRPCDRNGLRRGDIFVADAATPDATIGRLRAIAALIVDHKTARIEALAARGRRGQPHLMAIPAPPQADASDKAWLDWRAQSDFALRRLLLFCGALPAGQLDYGSALGAGSQFGLSLPETPARRRAFAQAGFADMPVLDGLRAEPGWIGAALSYRQIARAALAQGRNELLIAQDDALPRAEFSHRLGVARSYWRESGAAMFAGLVTDVDDSFRITRIVRHNGMVFLHLNKSVGLVFNIFGAAMLRRLADWDETDSNRDQNTIDRYVSRTTDAEVVTCLPYLVGHRPDHRSAVWGFRNARYNTLIRASERRLARMAGIALDNRAQ